MDKSKWEIVRTEDGLNVRLFWPKHDGLEKHPLFIFLHGSGQRGNDNEKQLLHIAPFLSSDFVRSKYPAVLLFPQCPTNDCWVPIDIVDCKWLPKSGEAATPIMKKLIKYLESFIENPLIDRSRIYLGGLSMGGFGTWDLLSRKPDWFAAAVPICGGADTTKVQNYSQIPIWTFHGSDDHVVPVELTRLTVESLKRYNAPIKYTEFPGVDHHSWDPAIEYPELLSWLFDQVKPVLGNE
jgi:predicted peptidase